jgi:hypothetical protein
MEEVIGILFMILVFGGFILKILGAVLENFLGAAKPRQAVNPPNDSDFAEKLRRHRQQKLAEARVVNAPTVDAQIIDEIDPMRSLTARSSRESESAEDYYKQSEYEANPIESRDDQVDNHLHQVFDHKLGSLTGSSASQLEEDVLRTEQEAINERDNLAAGIVAMLREPATFRKAFVLGEILQRPESIDRF